METNQEDVLQTQNVYGSMQNWEAARNNATVLQAAFAQGNMFAFTITVGTSSDYIHAYPALSGNNLVFHTITSKNDKEKNFEVATVVPSYVGTSSVQNQTLPVTGSIPQREAVERVNRWADTTIRNAWITAQANGSGIYQAFVIPAADIVSNQLHNAYFALKVDPDTQELIADLIIVNMATLQIIFPKEIVTEELGTTFYDMTRPVPPFKPQDGRARANFGLLNYILNN